MKKIQITARTRAPEPITQSVLDRAVELGKVLRLADWLEDQYDPTHNQAQAAAELRRLHDENQRLRLIVPQVLEDLNDKLCEDNLRLTAQRDQLIEALKEAMDVCGWPSAEFFYKALSAIAKAEENT